MMHLTLSEMMRFTVAEIDLGCVFRNYQELRRLLGESAFLCPMVKADAYGHGAIQVARILRHAGSQHLGVALIEEGLELRDHGDVGDILVFGVFSDVESASVVLLRRLTPVVSDQSQLEALASAFRLSSVHAAHVTEVRIHLKFNTGMNRLGFPISAAPGLREWLDRHPQFRIEGICTHLAHGEDAGAPGDTHEQFELFRKALHFFQGRKLQIHGLNSGAMAALRWRTQAHHLSSDDFEFSGFGRLGARPGLAIYGGQPSSVIDLRLPVEPVLKLKSRIMMLNQVATGERVSYNGLWRAERQSLIAVVPVGYADGYKRSLSNRGWVLCRGSRVPVVGAVCMDYLMIDVTDIKGAPLAIGEDLVLLGTQAGDTITVEELASWASTISFEILTGISGRVPRRYLNGTE